MIGGWEISSSSRVILLLQCLPIVVHCYCYNAVSPLSRFTTQQEPPILIAKRRINISGIASLHRRPLSQLQLSSSFSSTSISIAEDVVSDTSNKNGGDAVDVTSPAIINKKVGNNNNNNNNNNIINQQSVFSPAAQWHQNRRRQMLSKYGDQISPLERSSSSHTLALSLLALSNISLLGLSILSGKYLNPLQIVSLAIFPGSIFSLWTLQILHDLLHGSLLRKGQQTFMFGKVKRKELQDALMFWGSMPSVFGYYLYLKYGHLTHHKALGDETSGSLKQLFESDQKDFEDG